MKRLLTIVVIVFVLVGLVGAGVFFLQAQPPTAAQPSEIVVEDSVVVQPANLTVLISATGRIAPIRDVNLNFQLSAPVQEILVSNGEYVEQGTVLARLQVTELDNALANAEIQLMSQQSTYDALIAPAREVDIAVAEAALRAAQAQAGAASLGPDAEAVEIARLQAEIARNQLWQAQLQNGLSFAAQQQAYDQAQAFGVGGIQPPGNPQDTVTAQITQAENQVQLADVQVTGAQNRPADVASLSSANAAIVSAQIQLDRLVNGPSEMDLQRAEIQLQSAQLAVEQARINRARADLVAPFDGVIVQNNLVVGEVSPQLGAIQLIDDGSYYVDVSVDETDIVGVALGQSVELRLDALPDEDIRGTVSRVAVTPVRVGQLVTYTVRVTLDSTDVPIRVGMTTTASIVVNELQDVIALPNRFIRIERETQQAFVTVRGDDGGFMDVPVTLGVRNETESQILSGLMAGQEVVLIPREAFNLIGGPPPNPQ
jgi:HlyD family secretion protein